MTANLKRGILAFVIALILALPLWFEQTAQLGSLAGFICVLNLPGMLLGLVGGRFFPPEGYIGQSPIRFAGMVIVQSVIWYLLLWLVSLLTHRRGPRS
jgi:asparagine N-glycosylation enzyme membrane subunit Stt3